MKSLKNNKGFTLVELLIVVTIIGVLSTIAVPTFQRMVQKSRKTEAKVNLAALFTAESAFFSEYGGYGNHLFRMGMGTNGGGNVYMVGFPSGATCANAAVSPADPGATPAAAGLQATLQARFQDYWSPQTVGGAIATTVGVPAQTVNCTNYPSFGQVAATSVASATAAAPGIFGTNSGYIAVALGAIDPGLGATPAATAMDMWAINENRLLSNIQDGTQ